MVKRGISLYSYQQMYLTGKLDLEGCVKTAVDTGATGIELIYEQMPLERYPDAVYPNISDKGLGRWKDLVDKYRFTPTCMDSFIDVRLFKGRALYMQEQCQWMEQDLKLASKLGFSCIRVLAMVAPEVIERCIPIAEYYGVAMGQEIHPRFVLTDRRVQDVAEMARKHNTKFVGLIPDFGIFNIGVNAARLHALETMGESPELLKTINEMFHNRASFAEVEAYAQTNGASAKILEAIRSSARVVRYSEPEELTDLLDVVIHFHGKCNRIVQDGDRLYEPTINYEEPIALLKKAGWDGYISTEFEGQRHYHGQDCPYECDEVEQVRLHQKMLAQLIGA